MTGGQALLIVVALAVIHAQAHACTSGSVPVYDPLAGVTAMDAAPYPAPSPEGFHWQSPGSPGAVQAGSPAPAMILVRDGYSMPMMA